MEQEKTKDGDDFEESLKDEKEEILSDEEMADKQEAEREKEGDNFENTDERLKELGRKLEQARNDYIKEDQDAQKYSFILRRILGASRKIKKKDIAERFSEAKNKYENALKEYSDKMVETQVSDEEEARIIAEYLYKGENIKREQERDRVRIENSPFSERVKKGAEAVISRYRKLPAYQKIAIGVALGASGVGAAAIAGWRIFGTAVSVAGYKEMAEGIAKKRQQKKDEEKIENVIKDSKIKGKGEVQLDLLMQNLNEKITKIDSKIQKDKQRKRWRTWAALGVGAATFFGGKWVAQNIMDHFHGGGGHQPDMKVPGVRPSAEDFPADKISGGPSEKILADEFPEVKGAGGPTTVPEAEVPPYEAAPEPPQYEAPPEPPAYEPGPFGNQTLIIEGKGSGIESTLIKHFQANPELVDKYNELHNSHFNAGQIAHRMFEHFEPDDPVRFPHGAPDLVHEGDKVIFNPETMEIEKISPKDYELGYLHPETEAPVEDIAPNPPSTEGEVPQPEKTGTPTSEDLTHKDTAASSAEKPSSFPPERPISASETAQNIAENKSGLSSSQLEKLNELTGSATDTTQAIGYVIKELSLNDRANWEAMKDIPFEEARYDLSEDLRQKLNQVYEGYREVFGEAAEPRDGAISGPETLKSWVGRMTKMAIEKGK
jgi:hypothetical protein